MFVFIYFLDEENCKIHYDLLNIRTKVFYIFSRLITQIEILRMPTRIKTIFIKYREQRTIECYTDKIILSDA